jgi:hypothetical protein
VRGGDNRTGKLFSYVDLEARVRRDHPLRTIRTIVNEALEALEREFAGLYGMPRRRNRRSRKEDTHNRNPGQPARHPARLTHLTVAGEYLHAPACAGMEDALVGAKSLGSRIVTCTDDLVIPCRKRQSRRSLAATARSPARARRPRHAPTTRPVVPASTRRWSRATASVLPACRARAKAR